jgi:hypothetical protein
MPTPQRSQLEASLLTPPEPEVFSSGELEGLPEPAHLHLAQSIAPGTPLATSARLGMRGQIKVGRWLPFRARQVLNCGCTRTGASAPGSSTAGGK